ncbi:Sapep family Mn(2+)-dependent dipeptidase [Helcococcus kunzii]|uniref:Sapep family Mn(2+)-dependent dipeptidase n=1 Tax=Helcococcus kunzii TaxID=40091 RepID=UPI0021A6764C|nr:Sapep family Mn(2+)-dependent dipeptidase [Helcococcus kunzii]MCT1795918.1 Sapep family Mn(2+)-dependent dipeptidase [Helcococcus kunzii]MCT1988306.1 Sapep family Mn(2+)-dependent dipeptidase [Helcococcus kunzii]
MKKKLFAEIDRLKDQMIEDLVKIINIPSVKSSPKENAPFGENCRKVLDAILQICERENFTTKNVDGYMAYAKYGDSEEHMGIFGHLDVVPEGDWDDWICPPFSGKIIENRMYSRGALDNKGPAIAALYGLIALKNLGIKPKREIRIVFGADEESGMSDVDYYLSKEKLPVLGFVPDNKFPAIYGERARANIKVSGDKEKLYTFLNKYILNDDNNGKRLGIDFEDKYFGKLIVRGYRIFTEDSKESLRFQLSMGECDIEKIIEKIKEKAEDLEVSLINYTEAALKNPESTNVKLLNQAYIEATGQEIEPTTTTGMTYAHKIKTVIPFGPSFPGQNGIAHLPNEWMDIDDLVKCAKIYAYGIYKLNQVEDGDIIV